MCVVHGLVAAGAQKHVPRCVVRLPLSIAVSSFDDEMLRA